MNVFLKLNHMLTWQQRRQCGTFIAVTILASLAEAGSLLFLVSYFNMLANVEADIAVSYLVQVLDYLEIESNRANLFVFASLILIFLVGVKTVLFMISNYMGAKLPYSFFFALGNVLHRKYTDLSWIEFCQRSRSELVKIVVKSNELVAVAFLMTMLLISNVIIVLSLFILLLWYDFFVAATLSVFFGITGYVAYSSIRKTQISAGIRREQGLTSVFERATETFQTNREIKIFNAHRHFQERFKTSMSVLTSAFIDATYYPRLPALTLEFFAFFIFTIFAAGAVILELEMASLLATFILFAAAGRRALPTIANIIYCFSNMKNCTESVDIIHRELADIDMEAQASEGVSSETHEISIQSGLSLKDVKHSYDDKTLVLKSITLDIPKNETIALVGKSGAGKSTIIDIICGLLTPNSGELRLDDDKVTSFEMLRGNIGYVPQTISLLNDTIRENIIFDGREEDDEKMQMALKLSALDSYCATLPDGLDTQIGDNGSLLSGGQRQRLAIARALYHDPDILIFDEATSSLDNVTEGVFTNAIARLEGKKTIISIAHRITSIKAYSKIYVINDGKVVASGTHDELMQTSDLYKEIVLGDA